MNNASPQTVAPIHLLRTPIGFAVARAEAAKHIINIKDSIAKANNTGDKALARALTTQAKGIKNDLDQLIDLLADF